MKVLLTLELAKLLQKNVARGLWQTAMKVIREALRLLKEREAHRRVSRRETRWFPSARPPRGSVLHTRRGESHT